MSIDELTERQEAFCQYYAQLTDTYNNGTWSYALGYGHNLANASKDDAVWDKDRKKIIEKSSYDKMYNTCAVEASALLRKEKILVRVREIKATHFDDDKIVDSRLMDIIQKGKDSDSMAAIKHRNELKQRVKNHLDITSDGKPVIALVKFMGEDGNEGS